MITAIQHFYRVPLFGWMAKDAIRGAEDAKYYFVFNLVAIFALLVFVLGYPFVISFALLAAASGLTFLVLLTASDAFAKGRPRDISEDHGRVRRRGVATAPRRRADRP